MLASIYEVCNCMHTPLRTPETLETGKKKVWFDWSLVRLRKLQIVWQIAKSCVFICYFIGLVVKIVLSEAVTRGVLYKKVFLKFAKFTGKYKCQSHFFNEFAGATTFLLIVLTWKPLNIVYRKLMKFFKVLPKKDPKNACKR